MACLSNSPAPAEELATRNTSPLFDTTEVASHDLSMFPKWRHMLQAFEEEEATNCHVGKCDDNEWQEILDSLRGKDLMTQLRDTNVRINEKRYVADDVNWGTPDYWATPFEFLRKAGGDCEDYAIAKYMMLRDLGIPADEMRIVVLNDLRLHVGHAVLAVYMNGAPFILDNRYSSIVPANSLPDYQPVYSINETGWWLHLPARDLSAFAMPAAPLIGSVGGVFASQLASLPTMADAMRASTEIRVRYSAILTDSGLSTYRVDLGSKGIWYRVLAGPFESRNAAKSLCAQFHAARPSAACIAIAIHDN